jgi:hypothetical protein
VIVVADFGALLRWVGLVQGPPPSADAVVAPDALLAEVIQFARMRHDGRVGPMLADVAEVQIAVLNWYPSNAMAAQLVQLSARADAEIDAALLSPVALAVSLDMPLVTTSRELADLAPETVSVTLLRRR